MTYGRFRLKNIVKCNLQTHTCSSTKHYVLANLCNQIAGYTLKTHIRHHHFKLQAFKFRNIWGKKYLSVSNRKSSSSYVLAAFVPVGLWKTHWCTAQGVQCRSWAYFLVVCNDKVGRNFVGETEWHRGMNSGTKNDN